MYSTLFEDNNFLFPLNSYSILCLNLPLLNFTQSCTRDARGQTTAHIAGLP